MILAIKAQAEDHARIVTLISATRISKQEWRPVHAVPQVMQQVLPQGYHQQVFTL
jgi:hypothetical protein